MIALAGGFQLRSMSVDDLPAVAAIEQASQVTPWTLPIFHDCHNSGYDCRVIAQDETVAGFAILSSVLDEAHLLNIAIAPAFQRRALALNTLKELIRDYRQRQMRFLYLEVRASNVAAQTLYQRLGFVISGERKNYYLAGTDASVGRENAILMTLELSLQG